MEDMISCMQHDEFLKNANREDKAGSYFINEPALDSIFSVIKYFAQNFNSDMTGFSVVPSGDDDAVIRIRMSEFVPESVETFKSMRRKIDGMKIYPLDKDFVVEVSVSNLWKFRSDEELLDDIKKLNL